jgi:hypothetical protein
MLLVAMLHAPGLALADQDHVQFCWALGKFDHTIYFAEVENREDRQVSFEQLLDISGMNHDPVQCLISDVTSHRLVRAELMQKWLSLELETVNTTFLSDLDY